MVSKAWKELEKYVAEKLGGTRLSLSSSSYAESQPDVVVDTVSNPTLGAAVYDKQVSLIVECKYRTDHAWHTMVDEKFAKPKHGPKRISVVVSEDIVFWNIEDTASILAFAFGLSSDKCNLVHFLNNFHVSLINRKVSEYIRNSLGQARAYGDWAWKHATLWVPVLCLGKRGSHRKIMACKIQDLWGIPTEYGLRKHQATGKPRPCRGEDSK